MNFVACSVTNVCVYVCMPCIWNLGQSIVSSSGCNLSRAIDGLFNPHRSVPMVDPATKIAKGPHFLRQCWTSDTLQGRSSCPFMLHCFVGTKGSDLSDLQIVFWICWDGSVFPSIIWLIWMPENNCSNLFDHGFHKPRGGCLLMELKKLGWRNSLSGLLCVPTSFVNLTSGFS